MFKKCSNYMCETKRWFLVSIWIILSNKKPNISNTRMRFVITNIHYFHMIIIHSTNKTSSTPQLQWQFSTTFTPFTLPTIYCGVCPPPPVRSILQGGERVSYTCIYTPPPPLLNIRELVLQLHFFTSIEIFTEDASSSISAYFRIMWQWCKRRWRSSVVTTVKTIARLSMFTVR